MKKRGKAVFYLANILLPLLAGLLFYLAFREDCVVSRIFYEETGIERPEFPMKPGELFNGYFADMLWGYSLTFAVSRILEEKLFQSFLAAAFTAVAVELLQAPGIFKGTFDPRDIAAELLACMISIGIIYVYKKRKNLS